MEVKSLKQNIIYKIRKNPLGILSFSLIVLAAFITVFAYPIASDRTVDANRQNLVLAYKPMGFKQQLLQIPLANYSDKFFLRHLFFGKPIDSEQIAIITHNIAEDKKELSYIPDLGSGIKGEEVTLPLSVWTDKGVKVTKIKNQIFIKTFVLGTDSYGRDFYSRLVIGTRISFLVGFIAVFISVFVGITLGALAGYYKGWVDNLIMWLINVVWSIPTLLLVIAITLALGKGFWQIFIAVGLTMWVEVARIVRGQFLSYREKEFVEAARALGFSDLNIIFKQILPNVVAPVIVISAANFASAILMESGLSFLGIGAQPPTPSWGNIIKEHYAHVLLGQQHLAILPGLCIVILVLAFNIFGNVLRDVMDIKN